MMKTKAVLIAAVVAATFALFAGSALAKTIKIAGHSPAEVKKDCGGATDLYFPPNKNGVYGCVHGDSGTGGGIVCGGKGSYKNTCDTFIKMPPHLPTRAEIEKAEKAMATPRK